jgi:hypothetical protein
VNELAPHRLNPFLADLTQAMRSTAETAKLATVEQCRADAKAYIEHIQARTADEAGTLREDCEADLVTIRAMAKAQTDRVRVETQTRVAKRMENLEQELADYNAAIEREVQAVEQRVAAFQDEVTRFFETLLAGGDPSVFANMAWRMPSAPEFDPEIQAPAATPPVPEPGPSGAAPAAPAPAAPQAPAGPIPPAARAPLLPGTLSGAGAVRGRLYTEWYPEVERLRAIGAEADAVALLLDMVFAAEGESRADGSYIASRPYEELAGIFLARNNFEEEQSILERFNRQEHAPNAATARLLERLKVLKKTKR